MKLLLFLTLCLCAEPALADIAIGASSEEIQNCVIAFSDPKNILFILLGIILFAFSLLLLFLSKNKKHSRKYSIVLCILSILLFCSSLYTYQRGACLGYKDCETEVAKNSHRIHSWCEEMMNEDWCQECSGMFINESQCDECQKTHWQFKVFKKFKGD